jgi:predicted Fe-S protein YdhL (DUF1289 family)
MANPRAADVDDPNRVASPCISICRIDEASGLCIGCLRTLDEIAAWSVLAASEKRAVIAALPARKSSVSVELARPIVAQEK